MTHIAFNFLFKKTTHTLVIKLHTLRGENGVSQSCSGKEGGGGGEIKTMAVITVITSEMPGIARLITYAKLWLQINSHQQKWTFQCT